MSTIHPHLSTAITILIHRDDVAGHNFLMIDHEKHNGQLEIRDGRLYYYEEIVNHTNDQLEKLLCKLGEKAWGKDKLTPDESTTNGRLYIKAVELGSWVRDMNVAAIKDNIEEIVSRFSELPLMYSLLATKQIEIDKMICVIENRQMKKYMDDLIRVMLGVSVLL